uniref:Uncharacterized protein n=1 Tax=Oryza sativa subsp. japonica TaxID=39947 RepID=Q6K5T5_ORYSJ|nr:hypothetical protein [Oryza sativa Japonica Group]
MGEGGADVAGEMAETAGNVGRREREWGGIQNESRPLRACVRTGRAEEWGGDVGAQHGRSGARRTAGNGGGGVGGFDGSGGSRM